MVFNWENPLEGIPPIQVIGVDAAGDYALFPLDPVGFNSPAAMIAVGEPQPQLTVVVPLQGPSRPDEGFAVPLDVMLFEPGADVLNDTPVAQYRCDAMQLGFLDSGERAGVCQVSQPEQGTFDIAVKSPRTLLHVSRSQQVPGEVVFANALTEGDLDEDGLVGLLDFTLFLDSWQKQAPIEE